MTRNETQTRFWILAAVLFVGVLWLLKPMLLPFLIGMAIAYFLNPVVDKITSHKLPRWLAALMVLAIFALVITLLGILIVPMLENQIGSLVTALPGYVQNAREVLRPRFESYIAAFSPDDVDKVRDAATQYAGEAAGIAGTALKNIISGSFAIIDVFALLIITPVVAFYLMRDWPKVVAAIDSFIPRRQYDVVKRELGEIDASLSGFVRGQALVCVGLGLVYSIGLTVVGLKYGGAIGVIAGVLSFVPFVGTGFAWVSSIILAFAQFDQFIRIVFVAIVLLIGHVMESYVLTPRLVGERVGLHPVWIMFALIAGGQLMGFAGVLIAVPAAAVIGVLTRFAVRQYKKSEVYEGPDATKKKS